MPQSPQMAKFHEAMAHDNDLEFDTDVADGQDYVDVTDSATPAATAGATQVDKLADRIAPESAPAQLTRLDLPDGFDGKDYFAWMTQARVVVDGLGKPQRAAWMKMHADILKGAPVEVVEWAQS